MVALFLAVLIFHALFMLFVSEFHVFAIVIIMFMKLHPAFVTSGIIVLLTSLFLCFARAIMNGLNGKLMFYMNGIIWKMSTVGHAGRSFVPFSWMNDWMTGTI